MPPKRITLVSGIMKIVILTNCKLCAYVQNGGNSESNDLLGLTLRVKPAPIILDKNAMRQSTKGKNIGQNP